MSLIGRTAGRDSRQNQSLQDKYHHGEKATIIINREIILFIIPLIKQ